MIQKMGKNKLSTPYYSNFSKCDHSKCNKTNFPDINKLSTLHYSNVSKCDHSEHNKAIFQTLLVLQIIIKKIQVNKIMITTYEKSLQTI